MKILQVVTLAGPDAAYGGPLRVALNQTAELRRRGHDVELVSTWLGSDPPTELAGMPVRLFRARRVPGTPSFTGVVSGALTAYLLRRIRRFDFVHVHAARDWIPISAMAIARAARVPYVTQTHGMVIPDGRRSTALVDAVAVRRLLRHARINFVLTPLEESQLPAITGRPELVQRLENGVAVPPSPKRAQHDVPNVLFCSRLDARKRPAVFVEAATALLRDGVRATFSLVGPDGGELPAVQALIAKEGVADRIRYEGALPYEAVAARLAAADAFVLPSVDEPFPMVLLEAMAGGVASICTDTCGLAPAVSEARAAVVTSSDPDAIERAMRSLATDAALRRRLGDAARELVTAKYSIESVVDRLEASLSGAASPIGSHQ